ncbi:uncharacterized protein LOC130426222 isoform X2 [Triplophysa dalaica]|uniref:uncharacterized protein LOC130426222 isoform X2 n=1 Tax=Triplophysa dalaica TaxID=1582913 RepID=UPI0024E02110|nr:uncharacterized protein LOC130426222 isoform X2 [Triplophysa dalaica]
MSGKAWTFTLLTTVSFFTINVHHAKSECMLPDLQSHFNENLLEDHLFEMKEFHYSKEEYKVLSLINTLCSTWNKNRNNMEKFEVIKTYIMMLESLFKDIKENNSKDLLQNCARYNCSDGYRTTYMNVTAFGHMYLKYCKTSPSDCPSEKRTTSSTSNSPALTASERTTSSKPEISQTTTAHECTASSKTTHSPISDTSESNTTIQERLADMSIKVLLAASLLLNVLLLFWLWHKNRKKLSGKSIALTTQGCGVDPRGLQTPM